MIRSMKRAQIATILTLVMAVIFLFIVITINIGNIAQEKTMISNASDGAALMLASSLGSLGNALRVKLELWGEKDHVTEWNIGLIGSILAVIGAIIFTVLTWGTGVPTLVIAIIGLVSSTVSLGFGMYNTIHNESPGAFKQLELKFQRMTFEQRMKESALQYALFAIVSDPNKLCADGQCGDPKEHGGCSDTHDLDMDGDTEDCIGCFLEWYNRRLTALPRLSGVVEDLFINIFGAQEEGEKSENPCIYVNEDQAKWKVINSGFWIDANNNNKVDSGIDGELNLIVAIDDPHNPDGVVDVVYAEDFYFTEWLEDKFIPLLEELDEYGYGLTDDFNDLKDNIMDLKENIEKLQEDIKDLYSASLDIRLQSFDEWITAFYNGSDTEQDWYDRMQEWIYVITKDIDTDEYPDEEDGWIPALAERVEKINECADSCWGAGPYTCGVGGGHCCSSACTCDEGCCCKCYAWCGCNPAGMSGGQLCASSHCPATSKCTTIYRGDKACCDIISNTGGLHYHRDAQPTPISSGGGGCGDAPCVDAYYDNAPLNEEFHQLNHITREHAIEYLGQFVARVKFLQQAFKTAYEQGQDMKDDPRFFEAIYGWKDKTAKGQLGEQEARHIAYVKLDGLVPAGKGEPADSGFQLPHIHTEWKYARFQKRTSVADAKGDFEITVARYDEDVGTADKSPLRNLWIFKSRQNAEGETSKIPDDIWNRIANPPACGNDGSSDFCVDHEAAKFVFDNGVVSQTRGYYGPGWTYKKSDVAAWNTKAERRNKDIKIQRIKEGSLEWEE